MMPFVGACRPGHAARIHDPGPTPRWMQDLGPTPNRCSTPAARSSATRKFCNGGRWCAVASGWTSYQCVDHASKRHANGTHTGAGTRGANIKVIRPTAVGVRIGRPAFAFASGDARSVHRARSPCARSPCVALQTRAVLRKESRSPQNRRRRDSNPRDGYPPNGFQDRRLQPLGHASWMDTGETAVAQCHLLRPSVHVRG